MLHSPLHACVVKPRPFWGSSVLGRIQGGKQGYYGRSSLWWMSVQWVGNCLGLRLGHLYE